jgi:hypothetical protein
MDAPLVIEIVHGNRIALACSLRDLSTYVFLEQEKWFEDEEDTPRSPTRSCGAGRHSCAWLQAHG